MGDSESQSTFQNYRAKLKMCTDTFWLCLFIVFCIVLITIAVFGVLYGNYLAYINGYDSFGNICGLKHNKRHWNSSLSGKDTSNKLHLVFFDRFPTETLVKICVEKCPNQIIVGYKQLYDYYKLTNINFCLYDFDVNQLIGKKSNKFNYMNPFGPCPIDLLKSISVKNRCAQRAVEEDRIDFYSFLNSGDVIQLFFLYIFLTWHYIAALSIVSVLISVTLIVLMRWLAKSVSWIICLLVIMANAVLCAELWYIFRYTLISNEFFDLLEDILINKQVIYVVAILVSVIMIVLLIIVFFLRKQILELKMVFEEATDCLVQLPGLLMVPSITLLVLIVSFLFSIYVMLCITTANYPEITSINDPDFLRIVDFQIVEYIESKPIRNSFWVYMIGFIWTTEFIIACEEFTLGATVVYWYFRRPINSSLNNTVRTLLKYHLGTVAKGSIVITLLKIPRFILTYLCRKLKKDRGYSLWNYRVGLLEKWIEKLNSNAYAVVAIEGIDFSPAARIAWNTMAGNTFQVKTVKRAVDFILFLAKLLVAIMTCLIGILGLKDIKDLHFYMAPVLFSTVFAFIIAHVVFAVFQMTIDTLFLCICEEKQVYGYRGRWTKSNLAKFIDHKQAEHGPIQVISMRSFYKQPFRSTNSINVQSLSDS